jgi:hypothetical protein
VHRLCATILPVAVLLVGCAYINSNLQTVEKGRLYRSAQMNEASLRGNIHKLGIRTVINLRGARPGAAWWEEEVAACRELGVAHHDLWWREDRLPEP